MRDQDLDYREIGWLLWLKGYQVGDKNWRPVFENAARRYDQCAAIVRKAQASENGSLEIIIERMWSTKKANRMFKRIRKALGPTRFQAVIHLVLSMATGTFLAISTTGYEDGTDLDEKHKVGQRHDDQQAMDIALGFVHAKSDAIDRGKPIVSGDYSSILRATFEPLEGVSMFSLLASIDPSLLRKTTNSMITLFESVANASIHLDRLFVKDAFGLGRAAEFARLDRNLHAGMSLIWTLVSARSSEKFHGIDKMANLFLTAAIAARKLLEASDVKPSPRILNFQRKRAKNRPK